MAGSSRTQQIPPDTLIFALYPGPPTSPSSLQSLHLHLLSLLSPLHSSYLFHHHPFSLSVSHLNASCPLDNSPANIPHLHGTLRFDDSIDDEWLVISLLFYATSAIPSLTVLLFDSDDNPLLIESAFYLPNWLNPDTSRNRVFVRGGKLHIISPKILPGTPTIEDALAIVRDESVDTLASDKVQNAVMRKVSQYPAKALENMHRVRVRVPVSVAQVLKVEPSLISLAISSFYNRDLDSMKYAAKMEKFLKRGEGEVEMVRVSVRMSRIMYGQLVQQNFQAPKGYPMPSSEEGDEVRLEAELGMKIACGFEMMYQERLRAGEEGKGSTWEAYKETLEKSGCFDGLLPGSKEYQKILNNAEEYYKKSTLFERTREILNAPVRRIDEILAMPYSVEDFNDIELPPNDDDSWLYSGEDELNTALMERQKELEEYEFKRKQRKDKHHKGTEKTSSSMSENFDLRDVAESMQAFVQKLSSFEGAEVPENRNSNPVELDADQFMRAMTSVFESARNEAELDGCSSSSDMDFDYSEDGSDLGDEIEGDDSEDAAFMDAYSDVLNKELNDTTLQKSFLRAQQQACTSNEGPSKENEMSEELDPVDVDVNLVKSLVDSFSSQQGLPGPASNLLGLMGVKIPPDAKK